MTSPRCRLCDASLSHIVIDLGVCPLANSFVAAERLSQPEVSHPLRAWVCGACFLVQVENFEEPKDLFSKYPYFSSISQSWLRHAKAYAHMAKSRFDLNGASEVVEVASNDGYLLQYFKAHGIPVFGIEPAANIAETAKALDIPTEVAFFGKTTAERLRAAGHAADLMPANNVLAHVPDIADFLDGFRILLKPHGVATFEFPHLLPTIVEGQFDQICQEHLSYLSLGVVKESLGQSNLRVFDVERLPTHGGSLRVFVCHAKGPHIERRTVSSLLLEERRAGLYELETYSRFAERAASIKCDVLDFLIRARREGKTVCGYGAAGKATTFVNYCGIGPELLRVVADRNPDKQNTWFPGQRIPVVTPEAMLTMRPDYVLILAWNLKDEIASELTMVREWNGRFVTAIPVLNIF